MIKFSYIRKLPNGKYRVFSEKGKNMGTFDSKEQAKKRLKQIEFFKHKKASKKIIDLTNISEISYSAIMRELRNQCDYEIVEDFLSLFKQIFDMFLINEKDPADNALPVALLVFCKLYPVNLKNDQKVY